MGQLMAVTACIIEMLCIPCFEPAGESMIADDVASKTYENLDGVVLPFTDYVRDLGIYHDSRLKYDQHISFIVHNAYSAQL